MKHPSEIVNKLLLCPYCGKEPEVVKGNEVYPGRLAVKDFWFYECLPCDAHVGCHIGSLRPLGTLANFELRKARNEAHKEFDVIWHTNRMTRTLAYGWLSRQMNIDYKLCHIGMFDVAQCKQAVEIVQAYKEIW